MRRLLAPAALLAGLAAAPAPAQEAAVEVDLELVLAVDISRSMDIEELRLQREGYVAAFLDPAVQRAIADGPLRRIAVTYVEWAGQSMRVVIAPWTLIDGPESAAAFARTLAGGRFTAALGTSISTALLRAADSFGDNGFAAPRRVIDVSGDGPNNIGPAVTAARDRVVARGIVINGLPVMLKAYDGPFSLARLDVYYEDCVIGGPRSFVLPVRERARFAETIRRKLILEIAGIAPPARARVMAAQLGLGEARRAPRIDCRIGEKRRRKWLEDRGWRW